MAAQAMDPPRRRSTTSLCAVWLLWLALLVPLAQSVALAHTYVHDRAAATDRRDADPAAQASACDLCLAAAALAGGPLLATGPGIALQAGPDPAPSSAVGHVWQLAAVLGYQSRAPPFSTL